MPHCHRSPLEPDPRPSISLRSRERWRSEIAARPLSRDACGLRGACSEALRLLSCRPRPCHHVYILLRRASTTACGGQCPALVLINAVSSGFFARVYINIMSFLLFISSNGGMVRSVRGVFLHSQGFTVRGVKHTVRIRQGCAPDDLPHAPQRQALRWSTRAQSAGGQPDLTGKSLRFQWRATAHAVL